MGGNVPFRMVRGGIGGTEPIKLEKQVIQLLFIDCCSLVEGALHIRISKSEVKKRRERTLDKLKRILSEKKCSRNQIGKNPSLQ